MTSLEVQRGFLAALDRGDAARVRELAAAGALLDQPIGNPGGETPLLRAINSGDAAAVALLLELGAGVNIRWGGPTAWTPLMFAHNQPEILSLLLASGADVHARAGTPTTDPLLSGGKGRSGSETALHLAAAANNPESVRLLVAAGAEVEARADNGSAPLDYAIRQGTATAAAEALVRAGAALTPERLETMHSAAHNPETDLLNWPVSLLDAAASRPVAGTASKPPGTAAPAPGEYRCPHCQALIYSRKARSCGQCGVALPPELLLTEAQATALRQERAWARDLADKLDPRSPAVRGVLERRAQTGQPLGIPSLSPQELLRRTSCADEFRRRDRPEFWLYAVGHGLIVMAWVYLFLRVQFVPAWVLWLVAGFQSLHGWLAWQRAHPICPNCQQNIRLCAAEYCHLCGEALRNGRCATCAVDYSWRSWFIPYAGSGNSRWIQYCPHCSAYLNSKVPRGNALGRLPPAASP